MKRLSAFLMVVALTAGMVGCEPTPTPQYDLTVTSTTGGDVITPGEGIFTYEEGAVVIIEATPASGYRFDSWTGDVTTVFSVNMASTTITMNGNCSIVAGFVAQYDLTIGSTTGGSVTAPGEGSFTYAAGTVVELVAEPEEGYRFVNWIGDVDTIADPSATHTTISIVEDLAITPSFVAEYVLTIGSTEGGQVATPGEATFTYDAGTVIDLVASADEAYCFANWSGDIDGIADVNVASTTVTMNSDCSITANFGIGIYDWYDLDAVRDNLEGGYVLMNDLDATTAGYAQLASRTANGGKGWNPIGAYGHWDDEQRQWVGEIFKGAFHGREHELRDIYINRPDESQIGLFGHVSVGGVIEDLGVANSAVTGGHMVGGLVGWNADLGRIRNCYYSGSVSGGSTVGGLVGYNHGIISNSYYNYDQVLINGKQVITIGALFDEDFQQWLANNKFLDVRERLSQEDGYYLINNVSDLRQLLAFGQDASLRFRLEDDLDLSHEPNFYIPYLAGELNGNGHRISNLTFNSDFVRQVGLFGFLCADVSDVGVENVRIIAAGQVGALAGCNWRATISRCCSTGTVTYGSGLVGGNWGTIVDSYSTVGGGHFGLVGVNVREATVMNSYSTGTTDYGLVGYSSGTISNSFWDVQTSGEITSAGGTGKTTAQMKSVTTFMDTATEGLEEPWNMIAVAPGETNPAYTWNIVDGETYPFLSWQSVS